MAALRTINTGLSFLLEIAMLIIFGYWSFHAVENPVLKWVLAIGVPLMVFVLWGLFLAPRAGKRTDSTLGIVISLGLFYAAAFMLLNLNQTVLGVTLFIVAGINRTLMVIWKQW